MNDNRMFKTYQRGNRELKIDEAFSKGVVFSRAPLDDEKMRLIINYDIVDEGESLRVRDGIRVIGKATAAATPTITNGPVKIHMAKDVIEEDSREYRNAYIIHDFGQAVADTNLKKCVGTFLDMPIPITNSSQYTAHTIDNTCLGYEPKNIETNGVKITDSKYTIRPVGCFAWDDNFYCFNSLGVLKRTRYNATNHTYLVENMAAKVLNPTQAMTSGFNMLSTDPYTFEDTISSSAVPNFKGIMLYSGDKLVANPMLSVPYTLRAFYEMKTNATYQIKFSYRSSDTESWTEIKSEVVTFDSLNKKLKADFTCPTADAIIQVAAYEPNFSVKQQPYSYWGPVGNTAKFSIIVTHNNTITPVYQWQKSTDGTTWSDISGATSDTLSVIVAQEIDGMKYRCKCTDNTYGRTIYSNTAKLTVASQEITADPTVDNANDSEWSSEPKIFNRISISYASEQKASTANKDLPNYNMYKSGGMVYWKNYLWLYGNPECPTALFRSQINEPTYFPYPNGVDFLNDPILKALPFNDTMLLFTKSQILQVTLAEKGWTTKVLQSNLDFNDYNVELIQLVKNMVFFQSGDYYYMIVPKTLSLQNELAIAPISKNIEYFLDNFTENVDELIKSVYGENPIDALICHYNYLNYEDVHNIYTFSTSESGVFLNVDLLYSTTDRHWRIYTYETDTIYTTIRQDATKSSILIAPYNNSNVLGIQFLYPDSDSCEDNHMTSSGVTVSEHFKNWQLLDTGYRDNDVDMNKRFRELQIKFNNVSTSNLYFHTEFILDGSERIGRYVYKTEQNLDPTSDEYGFVTITRVPIPENLQLPTITETPGSTVLGTTENDWVLDLSAFPEVAFWKARLKISGKGYTPRFRIRCESDRRYEILGYTWVYRMMYAR